MKKIIFYSMPGHGHTNPTLNVARELVNRGYKVIYYSIEEFRKKIEDAGVEYRSYDMKYYFDPILSRNLSAFARKGMENTNAMSPALIKEAEKEKPVCVVHDSLSLWGKIVGTVLQVPTVSLFTTFAINNAIARKYPTLYIPVVTRALLKSKDTIGAYHQYLKLCLKYGIHVDKSANFILAKDDLNLVFTSSMMQPCSESFGKTFKFTGPSLYPRNEKADFIKKFDKRKKIIYISLGTIFTDDVKFYRESIQAFTHSDYQIIMSLGNRISLKDLPVIPENIVAKNHIPQLEVLQKADLFITHAGMNSISESLYYGVPMILVPQMYEQELNAYRIQELGAGKVINNEPVTQKKLLRLVETILANKSYRDNAEKIGKSLKDAGGYQKAADEIIDYIQSNKY